MKKTVSFNVVAEPFGAPDGTTREFQLEYQGQKLIRPSYLNVTAMHQTDWQGRVALSSQPRTNQLLQSQNLGSSAWTKINATVATGAGVAPDGTNTMNRVIATANAECQVQQLVPANVGSPVTVVGFAVADSAGIVSLQVNQKNASGTNVRASFINFNVVTGTVGQEQQLIGAGSINGFVGAALTPLDSGVYQFSVSFNLDAMTANSGVYMGPSASMTSRTAVSGTSLLMWGLMALTGSGLAYIPTTSAPVTVTDYAVDSSGDVTLGQSPAVDATLDWDGSATCDFVDASATFLSQYATSPIITSLIQTANVAIDPNQDFDQFMSVVWNVYTAQGFGLDVWGRIVNVPRTINIPASSDFLGFDEALPDAEPFNQAPFYSGPQAGTLYTLSDDAYRVLILTKALANISSFTAESMNALLNFMFNGQGTPRGSCYVLETATPMQIQYVFNFALQSWEAAILEQASLMPRPAGVGITIIVNP